MTSSGKWLKERCSNDDMVEFVLALIVALLSGDDLTGAASIEFWVWLYAMSLRVVGSIVLAV